MKLAFIDEHGDLHSVAHRVQQQGDLVRYWIRSKSREYATIGDGIVPKAASLEGVLSWKPDVVVCYGSPDAYAACRAADVPVIGSSHFTERLEQDREFARRVAEDAGLATSVTREFTSLDDALQFAASTDIDGWVLKAEGKDLECATTRVCPSRAHLRLAVAEGVAADKFIMQEIVQGVEVSTQGFFDYRVGWLRPFDSTLERKRLMPGDPPAVPAPGVGPNTGAMGSVVWPWPSLDGEDPRLPREVLLPHTALLEKEKVIAPFDVNAILGVCSRCGRDHDPHVPHWLEYTPRFGWDAFDATMVGFPEGALARWLVAWGNGGAEDVPYLRDPEALYFAVLRLLVRRKAGVPVIAPWRSNPHFLPKDVRYDDRAKVLRTTGTNTDAGFTVIAELGRTGQSPWEAAAGIYKRLVPSVVAEDLVYRNDLHEYASRAAGSLAALGYSLPDAFSAGAPTTAMPPPSMLHSVRST